MFVSAPHAPTLEDGASALTFEEQQHAEQRAETKRIVTFMVVFASAAFVLGLVIIFLNVAAVNGGHRARKFRDVGTDGSRPNPESDSLNHFAGYWYGTMVSAKLPSLSEFW